MARGFGFTKCDRDHRVIMWSCPEQREGNMVRGIKTGLYLDFYSLPMNRYDSLNEKST